MTTTGVELGDLLADVNDATKLAKTSEIKRKEQQNNAVGTLVKDPATGEYRLRRDE